MAVARVLGGQHIYEIADLFRNRCLIEGRSLLWPKRTVWTTENIASLWDAFIGHPDESSRSFFEKWHDQLAGQPQDVHRVAVDVIAFYHLFPSNVNPETKLADVRRVVSWKLEQDQPDFGPLEQAYSGGIGGSGPDYQTGRPWQVAYYLDFARAVRSGEADPLDPVAARRLADSVKDRNRWCSAARHILLHLFFPDRFERIASERHKRFIVQAFASETDGVQDLDDALANIRGRLTERLNRQDLDFYDEDIERQWRPGAGEPEEPEKEGEIDVGERRPRWWIEKTHVRGRPHRQDGEYALGRALWSPQRDRRGGNTYRFMREIEAGDVVLHLTDGEGFTAISRAAGRFEEFGGIADSEWGERPSYLVRVRDFVRLDTSLDRQAFFASPFGERLLQLMASGVKNLFYNRSLQLRQGAYLTPAPPGLVTILNDAYEELTGRAFPGLLPEEVETGVISPPEGALEGYSEPPFEEIVRRIRAHNFISDDSLLRRYHLSLKTHRFVILSGVSGTGKTWLTELYARATGAQYRLVPVSPSWNSDEDLLGFSDPLHPGVYRDTEFSRFLKEAAKAEERARSTGVEPQPFHVCLDEMNLARVEQYFANFLSAMERGEDGRIRLGQQEIPLPQNLHFAGTVNMDETTHGFADKVYDRAQPVEFTVSEELIRRALEGWDLAEALLEVWRAVSACAPFGFRVCQEVRAYVEGARQLTGDAHDEHAAVGALDEQIFQKVLPKLRGQGRELEEALDGLIEIAGPRESPRYPLTLGKATRMRDQLDREGFATFH